MEITDDIIFRFLSGSCTPEERTAVLDEIAHDPAMKKELIGLKNLYVSQSLPEDEATAQDWKAFREGVCQSETKAKRTKYLRRVRIVSWGAAAVVTVLLALNLHYHWSEKRDDMLPDLSLPAYVASHNINTLYTPKGVKGEVTLPDGSKIALNSDSRITYPARFRGSTREVEFSGEGYFRVEPDSLHPMVVRCSRGFRVEVYGTTFNLKAYDDDEQASATLVSGAIRVVERKNGQDIVTDIAPNQAIVIGERAMIASVREVPNIQRVSEWKEGRLTFESTPLIEAVKIMERWHGYKIEIENPALCTIPITAHFTTESIVQILELLKFSTGLTYSIRDRVVMIK